MDARGQLSHFKRCHSENERTLPRSLVELDEETELMHWLQKVISFSRAHPTDDISHIYTDGTYDESEFDLHSLFDSTAVKRHEAARVIIIHYVMDWK